MSRYANPDRDRYGNTWTSLIRVVVSPNGVGHVVVDEQMAGFIEALLTHDMGADADAAIFAAAAAAGRVLELGAIDGLLDACHRQRASLNQEVQ